jgi:hypothetical protein
MKPFERSCLYNAVEGMRVIEANNEDEYNRLLQSGEWFDHPNKVKGQGENHEKQIRRKSR